MKFKTAIISSLCCHVLVFVIILFKTNIIRITIDLQKGISSIAVHINKQQKNILKDHNATTGNKKEYSIIISSGNKFIIPPESKTGHNRQTADQLKTKQYSKKIIGALHKLAQYNAQNNGPHYPYIARQRQYEGSVYLDIEILPTGRVGSIIIIKSSGYPILDKASIRAAKKWVFFDKQQFNLDNPVHIEQAIIFKLKKYNNILPD